MAKKKITQKAIDAMKPGESLHEGGFVVRAGANGASFGIKTDLWRGQRGQRKLVQSSLRYTFAPATGAGHISVEEARQRATALLLRVKAGEDIRQPTKAAVPSVGWTVKKTLEEYTRTCGERTGRDMQYRVTHYLSQWLDMPMAEVTGELVRARHAALQSEAGPHSANRSVRDFRALYNLYARTFAHLDPPPNPVAAIGKREWAKEAKTRHAIRAEDLAAWYVRLQSIPSELRKRMHLLGLLSGLRPSNLVAIERVWINLDARRIDFPAAAMKTREAFTLPLSAPMAAAVREALDIGAAMHPRGKQWLFPTRDEGEVKATSVTREKKLKNPTTGVLECGYVLRHSWSNFVLTVPGVALADREMLMAHKLPGVAGVYTDAVHQFDNLLAKQELISGELARRLGIKGT